MQGKGFEHRTEKDGCVFNVFFYKNDVNKSEVKEETKTSKASPADYENVVGHLEPEKKVIINLVWEPKWTPDKMTVEAKRQLGM